MWWRRSTVFKHAWVTVRHDTRAQETAANQRYMLKRGKVQEWQHACMYRQYRRRWGKSTNTTLQIQRIVITEKPTRNGGEGGRGDLSSKIVVWNVVKGGGGKIDVGNVGVHRMRRIRGDAEGQTKTLNAFVWRVQVWWNKVDNIWWMKLLWWRVCRLLLLWYRNKCVKR